MGDDSEWLKLSTEDKCTHKIWKARLAGYEEAAKLFSTLDDKSSEFSKYLGLIKKFVIDSNAFAQEKGLDAALNFVENAHVAGKTVGEVSSGIITKCLGSSKVKTKEKGMEILYMYIEIEKGETVQEELMKGLQNKQPKIVAACIQVFRESLCQFGSKTISIKPLVKSFQKLLEDRDKLVREEAKLLVVEIYRWIGAAIRPQISNLKPVQISELETEFEQVGTKKAVQTRWLRSQQAARAKAEEKCLEEGSTAPDGVDENDAEPEINAYDLLEPVDILSKLPKDFYDKIEEKKWQERKEVLDVLLPLSANPKLSSGDYADLVKALKKVISKDTNVMLVTLGAKCLGGIAAGLKKRFSPYALVCIDAIIEKFKEKKLTLLTALREAIDAVFLSTNLEAISETVVAALDNKNPSIKSETASFLSRCIAKSTPATLPKKLLKTYCTSLIKLTSDSTPEVRENSFLSLGTAMKLVGEKPILPLLADIDSIKQAKIKEYCEKAVIEGKGGKASSAVSAGEPKPGNSKPISGGAPASTAPSAPSSSKTAVSKAKTGVKNAGKATTAQKKKEASKPTKKANKDNNEVTESLLSDEVVEQKISDTLSPTIVQGLANANWKERLAAMESFTNIISGMPREDIPCQVFLRLLSRKPGLKETNFQVLKLKVEFVGLLARKSNFSKTSTDFCVHDLTDKISDGKSGSAVQQTLLDIAECVSLEYLSLQVIGYAFDEQKNPKNQSESLNWLAQAIKEFGLKVNIKALIAYLKKAFAHTNPAVRTAALGVLTICYQHMGSTVRVFFENEKAALLQQIDAEFEKVSGQKPPPPVRFFGAPLRGQGDVASVDNDEEDDEKIDVADMIPRNDISDQITDTIIEELSSKNWKIRNEALQKVTTILNDSKFITTNVGSLPEALKLRLGDNNKILVNTTLTICQTIATAMGPHVKKYVPVLGPAITNCCGDGKPNLRSSAVAALNEWTNQTGLNPFIEAEVFGDALKMENPNLRIELLGWLTEKLLDAKKLSKELTQCLPSLYSCLEDRNGDVRKKAQESLVSFMVHLGYEPMFRQATKLKSPSKEQVIGLLEKARSNLPPKTTSSSAGKVKAAAPAVEHVPSPVPTPSIGSPSPIPSPEEDYESESHSPKQTKSKVTKPNATKKSNSATTNKKKEAEVDDSPPLKCTDGKEQRFKDERTLKVLKWNFSTPRAEFIDQLKAQAEPSFSKGFFELVFHADFKQHMKAMDILIKVCDSLSDAVIANFDIILKWLTIRFFETNTSILLKSLELLQCLFNVAINADYHMNDLEAQSFIPYLINKIGDPKDVVRKKIRLILNQICQTYPASKMFILLLDGLKSKNSKQRTECLEELQCLIEIYGITVCQPSPPKALKIIAENISDRDKNVRLAALNSIVAAYHLLGETVYKYIGKLSEKDASMLEERIKRSSKSRPNSGLMPKTSPEEKPKTSVTHLPTSGSQHSLTSSSARPQTAPEGGAEMSVGRGKRHEFSLNLDPSEASAQINIPKLEKVDIADIMNEPVRLPKTRSNIPRPGTAPSSRKDDGVTSINLVISQIINHDVSNCVQALQQIDQILRNNASRHQILSHVDNFLVMCSIQLRKTAQKVPSTEEIRSEIILLYKCLLASIESLFLKKDLAARVSGDMLKDLIHNLVNLMLDPKLSGLGEDATMFIKSVNQIITKIVETSDFTTIISALIKLLHESISKDSSDEYTTILMKCLWKTIRMLPKNINELNIDQTLSDVNTFLVAFPFNVWTTRSSNLPSRTIRTIAYTLAKLKNRSIFDHLSLIENGENSEIKNLLLKALKSSSRQISSSSEPSTTTDTTTSPSDMTKQSPKIETEQNNSDSSIVLRQHTTNKNSNKNKRLSKDSPDRLVNIFKKVGSKEHTKEGLNDLYDFKLNFPDEDVTPYLKKCSAYFQNYVQRGLQTIERERAAASKDAPTAIKSEINYKSHLTGSGDFENMMRLKEQDRLESESFLKGLHDLVDPTQIPKQDGDLVTPRTLADARRVAEESQNEQIQYMQHLETMARDLGLSIPEVVKTGSVKNGTIDAGGTGVPQSAKAYRENVENVRARANQIANQLKNDEAPASPDKNKELKDTDSIIKTEVVPVRASSTTSNLEDLRKRLELIKNSTAN